MEEATCQFSLCPTSFDSPFQAERLNSTCVGSILVFLAALARSWIDLPLRASVLN